MSMAGHGFCHIPFELNNWDKGGRREKGSRVGRWGRLGYVAYFDLNIRIKSLAQHYCPTVSRVKKRSLRCLSFA